MDLGAENLGVSIGPDAFRYQGMIQKLTAVGFRVEDTGNIAVQERAQVPVGPDKRLRRLHEILRVSEDTARRTEAIVRGNRKALILGGDHSVCLGAVAGAAAAVRGDLGLIYIDAHGDMNTEDTTPTGNIHGMHLASLMGYGSRELAGVHGAGVKIKPDNLLHIGGSDFDDGEQQLIAREHLNMFTLLDLLTRSLGSLFPMIDKLSRQTAKIWVSLDLDAIDKTYAPGAGMPNAKGLSYREIAAIAEYIGNRCQVVGVDIVEYNPLQDEQGVTAELATELAAAFFGKRYSWYTNYLDRNSR